MSGKGAVLLGAALALGAATLAAYAATGVAPLPAPRAARRTACDLLAAHAGALAGATVYDLGCGFGSLVFDLARAFPAARIVGIEISPLPWAVARLRAIGRRNVEIRFGDFFRAPLDGAGAVACYLMLRPMARLAEKLDREVAPGTPVAALAFFFRGKKPIEVRRAAGVFPIEVAIYRWKAERRKEKIEAR